MPDAPTAPIIGADPPEIASVRDALARLDEVRARLQATIDQKTVPDDVVPLLEVCGPGWRWRPSDFGGELTSGWGPAAVTIPLRRDMDYRDCLERLARVRRPAEGGPAT